MSAVRQERPADVRRRRRPPARASPAGISGCSPAARSRRRPPAWRSWCRCRQWCRFLLAAVALALLASLVGRAVDALGDRLGAGATGVLQSALGNLPELFVCIFALRDGLYDVVRAALVGSVLANVLLVLGLAFIAGGWRHGTQRFGTAPRADALGAARPLRAAWLIPSLTAALHTPASGHEEALSIDHGGAAPGAVRALDPGVPARGDAEEAAGQVGRRGGGRRRRAVAAALDPRRAGGSPPSPRPFVSDWFVDGLTRRWTRCTSPRRSPALVVVAIAGNAVENVVGIQLAAREPADYALSVILQSPLQIALVLAPVLVLVAPLVGATFTLVLSPLLVASLIMAVIVTVLVVNDGESTWLEGVTLVGAVRPHRHLLLVGLTPRQVQSRRLAPPTAPEREVERPPSGGRDGPAPRQRAERAVARAGLTRDAEHRRDVQAVDAAVRRRRERPAAVEPACTTCAPPKARYGTSRLRSGAAVRRP
jgi:Ca2+:H+ antiporter